MDANATEFGPDPGAAVAFVVRFIYNGDFAAHFQIPAAADRDVSCFVAVVTCTGDVEFTAHLLNTVFVFKLPYNAAFVFRRHFSKKMAAAFFKISRSIFKSEISAFSLRISSSVGVPGCLCPVPGKQSSEEARYLRFHF